LATFPERAVAAVNSALVAVFDAALAPLLPWSPLAGLLAVAVVTAVGAVLVMRRVSDQPRLRATRRRMQAALFEIRLHADDPVAVLRSFRDMLAENAVYLRLNLVSVLWLIVPLSLMVAQLQAFYGYSGLRRGEPALITVEGGEAAAITLEAPREIRVESEAVRLVGSGTTVWRIVPEDRGVFAIALRSGGHTVTKTIVVGDAAARRSPIRTRGSLQLQLLYPSEPLIPDGSGITSIAVRYPDRQVDLFGWRLHWLIVFGLFSLPAALLAARALGVTI
jgi:hypothetical protein